MAKCEKNNCLEVEVKLPIEKKLDELEKKINEKLESLNSNWKMYSYEKNENWTFNLVVNWLKYEGNVFTTPDKLINAMKIFDRLLNIYMKNWNKNDFYLSWNNIYLNDSYMPFRDSKVMEEQKFMNNISNKYDIQNWRLKVDDITFLNYLQSEMNNNDEKEKFVNFLNQVTKIL